MVFSYPTITHVPRALADFLVNYQASLAKTQQTKTLGNYIGALLKSKEWIVFLPILWVGWAVLPDYISLLKTRVVLLILKHIKVSALSLFALVLIDFLLGILFFFGSFVLFQFIYISIMLAVEGYWVGGNLTLDFIMFWIFFSAELLFFTFTGLVFLYLPISSLFWASLLPSLWLWAYIVAALIARFALASKRFHSFLVFFLDFSNHPIRSLGVLASSLTGIILVICVTVYKFVSA